MPTQRNRNKNNNPAPISSRFDGPAPNLYNLPPLIGYIDHDFTKWKEPAYTLRIKPYAWNYETPGPGPAIFVDPRYTRHGPNGAPHYTMRPNFPVYVAFLPPGPADYEAEKCHPPQEPHAPKYTMRPRTRYLVMGNNPAPNQYYLPEVMGRGQAFYPPEPGWTILELNKYYHFAKDYANTPGPAGYDPSDLNIYRNRSPRYTMRPQLPNWYEAYIGSPGPAAHHHESIWLHKPTIPQFSFGVKHSEFAGSYINRVDSRCNFLKPLSRK